jgi:hypothetical protein
VAVQVHWVKWKMENSRERKEIVRGKRRRRGKARGGERWKREAEEEEERSRRRVGARGEEEERSRRRVGARGEEEEKRKSRGKGIRKLKNLLLINFFQDWLGHSQFFFFFP